MKQFFGAFFGSIVGMIIATLIALVIVVMVITSSISSAISQSNVKEENTSIYNNSVLKISLNGAIDERALENPLEEFDLGPLSQPSNLGLNMLIKSIDAAQQDDRIKGIFLNIKSVQTGYASLQELRRALEAFRQSGKFIYAYAENYGQPEYYLASVATDVFLHPQGIVEWKGLSMQLMFYKPALEKWNVDVQIFRHGKFKSAIEPYMLDKMSDANRQQGEKFLNGIWSTIVTDVSRNRNIPSDSLQFFADEMTIGSAQKAFDKKLVDKLLYDDEVSDALKKKLDIKESEKVNMTGLSNYYHHISEKSFSEKIAVIYANGEIAGGSGSESVIGSDGLVKALREARKDKKVKAVVLRVNSPGGSALASDVIWREALLCKQEKPLVVSMGNYAASGGYYISCPASRIFALENTITGSIGVYGILPNVQKVLAQHIGVNIDTVNTNKHSDGGGIFRSADEKERQIIQAGIENVYQTFITKVAEGRRTTPEQIDSIGQGRVWSGRDALEIGLVDELGGLKEALAAAAKMAKLKEYSVVELPRMKDPISKLLGRKEQEAEEAAIKKQLGAFYDYYKHAQNLMQSRDIQARLPYHLSIH